MLSGVGPADELRRHGISLVHHSPGVGSNLHDHLRCELYYRCKKPITVNLNMVSTMLFLYSILYAKTHPILKAYADRLLINRAREVKLNV